MTVTRILRDTFAVVVTVATLLHCATAKRTFVVGGNLGWKVPPKANSYAIWASNHTFAVDDILLFHFEEGKHTVAKVSKEAYEACNTSVTPFFIRRRSTAFVSLDTTGVKFFIDTVGDHCLKGQKVAVDVTIPGHSPTQPPPSTPSPPPPSPPSNRPPGTPPASPPPSPPSNNPPSSPATPPASSPPSPPSNNPPSSPATPPASTPPSPPSNNPPSSPATPPASTPPSPPSNNPPSSPATPPSTLSPPSPATPGPAVPPSSTSTSSPPPPTTKSAPPPPPNAASTAGAPIGVVLFLSIALGYLV